MEAVCRNPQVKTAIFDEITKTGKEAKVHNGVCLADVIVVVGLRNDKGYSRGTPTIHHGGGLVDSHVQT